MTDRIGSSTAGASTQVEAGEIARTAYSKHRDDDDFVQARELYRRVLSDTDREHMITNVSCHLSDGVTSEMQKHAIPYWNNIDPDIGSRVERKLKGESAHHDTITKRRLVTEHS